MSEFTGTPLREYTSWSYDPYERMQSLYGPNASVSPQEMRIRVSKEAARIYGGTRLAQNCANLSRYYGNAAQQWEMIQGKTVSPDFVDQIAQAFLSGTYVGIDVFAQCLSTQERRKFLAAGLRFETNIPADEISENGIILGTILEMIDAYDSVDTDSQLFMFAFVAEAMFSDSPKESALIRERAFIHGTQHIQHTLRSSLDDTNEYPVRMYSS